MVKKATLCLVGVLPLMAFFKLAGHRSREAWILGLYSLPYFLALFLMAGTIAFAGLVLFRFRLKGLYILFALAASGLLAALGLEGAGQIYAFFHPSYDVLAWEPDPTIGWKLVPNLHWTWTGVYWFAPDFRVPVITNSQGFRDREREILKPEGVVRIALPGDSFVEAVQVPLEKTAGQLLEQRLNSRVKNLAGDPARFEVLNFGISGFGVGQFLLMWEQYARRYHPDYTFVFVAEMHMNRTVKSWDVSTLAGKPKAFGFDRVSGSTETR